MVSLAREDDINVPLLRVKSVKELFEIKIKSLFRVINVLEFSTIFIKVELRMNPYFCTSGIRVTN